MKKQIKVTIEYRNNKQSILVDRDFAKDAMWDDDAFESFLKYLFHEIRVSFWDFLKKIFEFKEEK